jgi:hypothetical protein
MVQLIDNPTRQSFVINYSVFVPTFAKEVYRYA